MNLDELLTALSRLKVEAGSLACLGCGREHNCSTHGCRIIRLAEERLRALEREKQVCFRLGQMDMRESAAAKLRNAAANLLNESANVCGIASAALESAADLIEELETLNSDTGKEKLNAET